VRPPDDTTPRLLPRGHRIALSVFAVGFFASWWRPIWPAEQALHHSLTVLGVAALWWAVRRHRLPLSSFVCGLAFLGLHTVAARWIYSFVPYDHWTENLFGFSLNHVLGWSRNNFDRLVHFGYGALVPPIIVGHLVEVRRWRPAAAGVAAMGAILATGAIYEIFEWCTAVTLAPGIAEAYNGQQGDFWDSDKDMAIAALGALIVTVALVVRLGRRDRFSGLLRSEDGSTSTVYRQREGKPARQP
jgi:putative membrane protein